MTPITSRQNPRIKQAAALRNRKQRDATGRTLIDGPRETLRAIAADVTIEQAFICPRFCHNEEATEAIAQLQAKEAELFEVTPEVFDRLAYGDRQDGIVCVAVTQLRTLAELKLPERPLIAVIEGVEKPGNLGAILRTADGAGVDAIVVCDPVIDLFSPNVIRASVGTIFKPNVVVAGVEETQAWLEELGVAIYAAKPDAGLDCYAAKMSSGTAIVLGNEASGLTTAWDVEGVIAVNLPMHGIADSLNVSATAAILFYEARRQRK